MTDPDEFDQYFQVKPTRPGWGFVSARLVMDMEKCAAIMKLIADWQAAQKAAAEKRREPKRYRLLRSRAGTP